MLKIMEGLDDGPKIMEGLDPGDLVQIQLFEGMTPMWVIITFCLTDLPVSERVFEGDILKNKGLRIKKGRNGEFFRFEPPGTQTEGCIVEFRYSDIIGDYIARR